MAAVLALALASRGPTGERLRVVGGTFRRVAGDRRVQLVDAGVALAVGQRFQDLLASVDTRSITGEAGVTTGSFFHQFRNRGHFAQAFVDRFVEMWWETIDQTVAGIAAVSGAEGERDVRSAAEAEWDTLEATMVQADLQHLLWAAREQPLSQEPGETAGEVLARCCQYLLEAGVPALRAEVAEMGREMMPFDLVDLSVTFAALADGIQMRQAVQPDVVRPELFADLVAPLRGNVRNGLTRTGVHPILDSWPRNRRSNWRSCSPSTCRR